MSPRTRRFALLAGGALATMIAMSVAGAIAESQHWLDDPALAERAESIALVVSFGLFLVLGFSFVPLMVRLFIVGQMRIGNGEVGPIRWLRANEVGFVRGAWLIYAVGLAIAAPEVLRDLRLEPASQTSEGVLVARIGMPLDEVRRRSSLALGEGVLHSESGPRTLFGSPAFSFELADSGLRVDGCTYYFLLTGEEGDPRVVAISIGASPTPLTRRGLVAAQRELQQRLAAGGWLAGRDELGAPEDGATPSGAGSFWRNGDTVLALVGRRVDEPVPGEDPETAGAWIQVLELRPPEAFAGLRFEPPAR